MVSNFFKISMHFRDWSKTTPANSNQQSWVARPDLLVSYSLFFSWNLCFRSYCHHFIRSILSSFINPCCRIFPRVIILLCKRIFIVKESRFLFPIFWTKDQDEKFQSSSKLYYFSQKKFMTIEIWTIMSQNSKDWCLIVISVKKRIILQFGVVSLEKNWKVWGNSAILREIIRKKPGDLLFRRSFSSFWTMPISQDLESWCNNRAGILQEYWKLCLYSMRFSREMHFLPRLGYASKTWFFSEKKQYYHTFSQFFARYQLIVAKSYQNRAPGCDPVMKWNTPGVQTCLWSISLANRSIIFVLSNWKPETQIFRNGFYGPQPFWNNGKYKLYFTYFTFLL